jgi:isoleucyl-tRNA synthetase
LAPFTPFLAEDLFQKIKTESDPESIHLMDWPCLCHGSDSQAPAEEIDKKLISEMQKVRELVEKAHALRADAKIRVRQPLAAAIVKTNLSQELQDILIDELNVKKIKFDKNIQDEIELDTKLTPVLLEEGRLRDLLRRIQDLRKKAGLSPADKVDLYYSTESSDAEIIIKFVNQIKTETNISEIKSAENAPDDKDIWLGEK